MMLATTPSQTIGPFFGFGLTWADGPYVVPEGTPAGIWIRGRVLDGAGDPVPDALVETWQADANGRFAHPDDPRGAVASNGFRGFGRSCTDKQGRFGVFTLKPGRLPDPHGRLQAPHIAVMLFARGLLNRLVTRIYFADEAIANAQDAVLTALADPARKATLLATLLGGEYRFDIHLQGEDETAFFSV